MSNLVLNENGLLVGSVHPQISLKIVKIHKGEIKLGEEGWKEWEVDFGEIIVAGPHVLSKYHNSIAAFKQNKIIDGFVVMQPFLSLADEKHVGTA